MKESVDAAKTTKAISGPRNGDRTLADDRTHCTAPIRWIVSILFLFYG
jgi:hypothetical protein